jgi:hypothetical protein
MKNEEPKAEEEAKWNFQSQYSNIGFKIINKLLGLED